MSRSDDDGTIAGPTGGMKSEVGLLAAFAGLLAFTFAVSACGSPAATGSTPTGAAGTSNVSAATATVALAQASAVATVFTGTPSPLRTPTSPHDNACFYVNNSASLTAAILAEAHGSPISCDQLNRMMLLGVPGSSSDPRPGFLACAQPVSATDDFCGVGLAPVIASQSEVDQWQFLPFPGPDAKEVGDPVDPQLYRCVGNGSQLWTFHFDTLTYTSGCKLPPPNPYPAQGLPCDEFLYFGLHTTPDQFDELYDRYGKAAACGLYGTTVVGVVDGNPAPGFVVCSGTARTIADTRQSCGFEPGLPGVSLDVWHFIPLPVAAGPVDGATFDTAAGSACVTVGAQSFTFTLATMSVTAGCGSGAAATATA